MVLLLWSLLHTNSHFLSDYCGAKAAFLSDCILNLHSILSNKKLLMLLWFVHWKLIAQTFQLSNVALSMYYIPFVQMPINLELIHVLSWFVSEAFSFVSDKLYLNIILLWFNCEEMRFSLLGAGKVCSLETDTSKVQAACGEALQVEPVSWWWLSWWILHCAGVRAAPLVAETETPSSKEWHQGFNSSMSSPAVWHWSGLCQLKICWLCILRLLLLLWQQILPWDCDPVHCVLIRSSWALPSRPKLGWKLKLKWSKFYQRLWKIGRELLTMHGPTSM